MNCLKNITINKSLCIETKIVQIEYLWKNKYSILIVSLSWEKLCVFIVQKIWIIFVSIHKLLLIVMFFRQFVLMFKLDWNFFHFFVLLITFYHSSNDFLTENAFFVFEEVVGGFRFSFYQPTSLPMCECIGSNVSR